MVVQVSGSAKNSSLHASGALGAMDSELPIPPRSAQCSASNGSGDAHVDSQGAGPNETQPLVVIHPDAPDPQQFASPMAPCEILAVFARKSRVREQEITRIIKQAAFDGMPTERILAAMAYDNELAPWTTNRQQLMEIGIHTPDASDIPTDAHEVTQLLWTVIYGMADLGIYLAGTNHLTDHALLSRILGVNEGSGLASVIDERVRMADLGIYLAGTNHLTDHALLSRILGVNEGGGLASVIDERVRDVPPCAEMSEFVDFGPSANVATEHHLIIPLDGVSDHELDHMFDHESDHESDHEPQDEDFIVKSMLAPDGQGLSFEETVMRTEELISRVGWSAAKEQLERPMRPDRDRILPRPRRGPT
ncbi:MAG: hypothetical protein DWI12_07785 [Planctomycetota bacterium]|nr:MAG: hypothetical protein DWI12_07785 [Planctomycetota bacterium]